MRAQSQPFGDFPAVTEAHPSECPDVTGWPSSVSLSPPLPTASHVVSPVLKIR